MSRKAINWLAAIAGLGLILLVYSNHFRNEFHFDDAHTIIENAYIRDINNIPLYFTDCTTSSSMPSHQGYRPLVTTTLAIDYWLSQKITNGKSGYDELAYHISGFFYFILTVFSIGVVLFHLIRNQFPQINAGLPAIVGALWYGVNTVNAETVNYVISRSDILSTLAIVASFALYLSFPLQRRFYLYLLPAAIGMFAKETTIMFAPALIAYIYIIERGNNLPALFGAKGFSELGKSIVKGAIPLIVCVALAVFSISMTRQHEPGGSSVLWYALTQPYIILHYVIQFFFPFGLTADTDIPMVASIADDRLFIGLAFLIVLLVLAFRASSRSNWKIFSFGIVWFLLMLLPTSSFIPLAEVTNDHRAFLPNIGLVMVLVNIVLVLYLRWSLKPVLRSLLVTAILIGLAAYSYGTYLRNEVWKTDESLWKDVTEKSPANGRGWMNYGLTQMTKGDYSNALYAFNKALERTPHYYFLHINLGILHDATGNAQLAESYYRNALNYGGTHVEPYYYYAYFLFKYGRTEEAKIYTEKALEIFPGHVNSLYLLMHVNNYEKNWTGLKAAAERTLRIYPADGDAQMYLNIANSSGGKPSAGSVRQSAENLLNQSLALYNAGKFRQCIEVCYKALELKPEFPEAYNNICSAYNQLQQFDSAAVACRKALELAPEFELAKNNLKWAESQLDNSR